MTTRSSALDQASALLLERLAELEIEAEQIRAVLRAMRGAAGTRDADGRQGRFFLSEETRQEMAEAIRPHVASSVEAISRAAATIPVFKDPGSQRPPDDTESESRRARSKGRGRKSMRARVLEVLEEHDAAMTPAEIAGVIEEMGHKDPHKSDKQFGNAIRTALWQLRNTGDVVSLGDGKNIAARWLVGDVHVQGDEGEQVEPDRAASTDSGSKGAEGG